MSATIRRYIREKQDFQFKRGWQGKQLQASVIRQNFLKKFIINFDVNLYKTQEERDWAYICKRQYNYDVIIKSLGYALLTANVFLSWRIFVRKSMVWWPIFVVTPIAYLYTSPILLQKHTKKLFDMCNLGQEFYLGRKRNQVLTQCNTLLEVQDF